MLFPHQKICYVLIQPKIRLIKTQIPFTGRSNRAGSLVNQVYTIKNRSINCQYANYQGEAARRPAS
ncbi:hypothetical protein BHC57_03065 [Snodgrassella alvi]|uniref:Uncharacterized protein n=1 Tax=Snodgrassella alvi TaxID=1196083 RepID=A0A855FQR2_9NEIS|nr:hypothetical protein BHC57_03065 [Snodgrassella alvi]